MVFYGIGDAFRTGTHKAMIFQYLKIKGWEGYKVDYYGHTRSWSQLGSAVSSLIAAGIVIFTGSLKSVFLFSLIPYGITILNLMSYPRVLESTSERSIPVSIKASYLETLKLFIKTIKNRRSFRMIINIALFTGIFRVLKDYIQPLIKNMAISFPVFLGMSEDKRTALIIGLLFFILYFLNSRASRKSNWFARKFNNLSKPVVVTLFAGLIIIVIVGILYQFNYLLLSVILFMSIYIIENLRRPIAVSYISENTDEKVLASVLSAESFANTLVAVIAAPAVGFVADKAGLGFSFLVIAGLLLLISLSVNFSTLRSPEKK